MKNLSESIPAIAILAGGQSRRMGGGGNSRIDKALFPLAGLPMIQHVARAAAPLTKNLLIVGRSEIPNWPTDLPITFLPDPPPHTPGPTAAILHILRTTNAPTLLLACDTPLLTTATLAALWQFHQQQSPPPIATVTISQASPTIQAEPLLAIYTPEAIPALTEIHTHHRPLQSLLQNPATAQFLLPKTSLYELTNINDPATFQHIQSTFTATPPSF